SREIPAGVRAVDRAQRSQVVSSAAELPDHRKRLRNRGVAIARADRVLDASVQMVFEQLARKGIERRLHGGDLRQDIDAVAIIVEHVADAAYLALDTTQPARELRLPAGVARDARMMRQCSLSSSATHRRHSPRPRSP